MMSQPRFVTSSRACLFLAVVLAMQTTAPAAAARPQQPILLEPGKAVERAVDACARTGEPERPVVTDVYAIDLAAGQALEVTIARRGAAVETTVFGPDGARIAFHEPLGPRTRDLLVVVAETSGTYRLELRPPAAPYVPGTYTIEVTRVGEATRRDRDLAEAARLDLTFQEEDPARLVDSVKSILPLVERAERVLSLREGALGPDHPFVADTLVKLALLRTFAGQRDEADALCARAVSIVERASGPDHLDLVAPLSNLASIAAVGGDIAKALALRERSLAIQEKHLGPDHPELGEALYSLALHHWQTKDLEKAEIAAARLAAIYEKTFGPKDVRVAGMLLTRASLFSNVPDRMPDAVRLLERALAIYDEGEGPDDLDAVQVLPQLAELYESLGDPAKSGAAWERCERILARHPDASSLKVWQMLMSLAGRHRKRNELAAAEALLVRAAAPVTGPDAQRAAFMGTSAITEHELADLYRATGEYEKAERILQRLVSNSLSPVMVPVLGATLLTQLAVVYRAKGDVAAAVAHQARSNEARERNAVRFLTSGSARQKQVQLEVMGSRVVDYTLSLHLGSAPADPAAARLALESILRTKGRALDAMADSIGLLRRRAAPEDRALLDELAAAQATLATAALGHGHDAASLAALDERVPVLERRISDRSAEFRARFLPVTLAAVQRAIPPRTALVEFASYHPLDPKTPEPSPVWGARRYAVYVATSSGDPRFADLGDAEAIDALVARARAALGDPSRQDARRLARELDELVMRPVRALLGPEPHLLVAPDGQLNLVPFTALVDERDRYLVERYRVTYLSSGRDLLRPETPGETLSASVVVADPDFGPAPSGAEAANREITHEAGAPTAGVTFRTLPATAGEAEAVGAIVPGARIVTRAAATEAAVKRLASPRILHVATHGFFLPDAAASPASPTDNPLLRSGLAFTGANRRSSGEDDGLLTAMEVAGLDLWGTRLVVLSACNTGVGDVRTGEGVFGLRRALVLAGSESQVMTLWPVSDQATRDLMVAYYRRLMAGDGRTEALRRVQIEMLRSKDRAHPFFWAGVIQSGSWSPLSAPR